MDEESLEYGLDIYLSLAYKSSSRDELQGNALVEFTSPSGAQFEGLMNLGMEHERQRGFFDGILLYHYGEALRPRETGLWMMDLSLPENLCDECKINGVGVKLMRNGTR